MNVPGQAPGIKKGGLAPFLRPSAASQPFHFFLQLELLALQPRKNQGVWAGTMILVENPQIQVGVTLLQALDTGLQAHGASMLMVARRDVRATKT
jgi:hypothetical protein